VTDGGTAATVVDVFAVSVPPAVQTGGPSSVAESSATVTGTVYPGGGTVTACQFDYGTTTAYGQAAPCSPTTPYAGATDVTAQLSGLSPSTTYHFRLEATNADGRTDGSDQTLTTQGPPAVDLEAAGAGSTVATLHALLNPDGAGTTYHFEYGTTTSYGTSVPVPDADIGSSSAVQQVSEQLTGLSAGSTYHYRVVATNSFGTVNGPDETFTTYPAPTASCSNAQLRTGYSAHLPDCRAYELVTPPGSRPFINNGYLVNGARAATSGDALAWVSWYPIPGAQSEGDFNLSIRGGQGWSTVGVIPPQSQTNAALFPCIPSVFFSPDLSEGVLSDGFDAQGSSFGGTCGSDDPLLVSGEPQGAANLFLHASAGGPYQLVDVNAAGTPPTSAQLGDPPNNAELEGASSDLSHVVFEDEAQLTPDAPAALDIYEYSDGVVRLVSVLPDGTPVQATVANSYQYEGPGQISGPGFGKQGAEGFTNAVSADGSRVFFQANGNLYVREHADQPQSPVAGGSCTDLAEACTVQVDASQGSGSGGGGTFEWASSDGSDVFFTDDASAGLTADTVPDSGQNLYQYDLDTGKLTDLTPAVPAQVQGVSGVSDNGSYVYFVADGALAQGAAAGQPNLYLYHAGMTVLIATLGPGDAEDWTASSNALGALVSPNGRYLAFDSQNRVTGYDNTDQSTGSPDDEIYLYDADTGSLRCASCDPNGAAPTAPASLPGQEWISTTAEVLAPTYLQRSLVDDGRVFFDSRDALTPGAANGQSNVFESEPQGVGSCSQPSGCVSLISSGSSDNGSFFYDASPSGDDVFFITTQNLLGSGSDGQLSVYDARVNGGFAPGAGTPIPCANADTCQGPVGSAPASPSADTATFSGPGSHRSSGSPPPGKLRLLRTVLNGKAVLLTVRVPGKGQITISGADVGRMSRPVAKAGTYRLTVWLTHNAAKQRHQERMLSTKLLVRYRPSAGRASVSMRITVKGR